MPHILIELALSMFIIYTSPGGPNSSPSISIEQSRCVKYKQLLLKALLQFAPLAIKKLKKKKNSITRTLLLILLRFWQLHLAQFFRPPYLVLHRLMHSFSV